VDERPLWRRAFDAVDADLAPRLEQFVRTEQFADGMAFVNRLNKRARETAEELNRQALHFWNRPTASDVADLKRQLAAMDRQLRKLTKQLGESQRGDD
jgi:hypothetical protein